MTFVFIDEVFNVCVCVIVGGTEDAIFILFVQLYEFLLLICSLMTDMYINVLSEVILHQIMLPRMPLLAISRMNSSPFLTSNLA